MSKERDRRTSRGRDSISKRDRSKARPGKATVDPAIALAAALGAAGIAQAGPGPSASDVAQHSKEKDDPGRESGARIASSRDNVESATRTASVPDARENADSVSARDAETADDVRRRDESDEEKPSSSDEAAERQGEPVETPADLVAAGATGEDALGADAPLQVAQASRSGGDGARSGSGEGEAAADGESGAGEGFAGISFAPIAVAALALGAAAGGGGSGGGGGGAAGAQAAGFAAKGALNGATVFYDLNGNGRLDAGEPSTTTGADGRYTFTSEQTALGSGSKVIVQGGTYKDKSGADVAFNGKLVAPAGVANVTPFSTLKAAGLSDAAINAITGGAGSSPADFAAGTALETAGLKLFELLGSGALGLTGNVSAQKIEAVAKAIVATIENAIAGGKNLGDAKVFSSIVDLSEKAAQDAASAFDALAGGGGTLTSAQLATLNSQIATNAGATASSQTTQLQYIDYATARGASVEFDANGNFAYYRIGEGGLAGLAPDAFGAASAGVLAGDLYVDVEGTILGKTGAEVTFAQLNTLGVDAIVADPFAPYLRLLPSNIDGVAPTPGFQVIDSSTDGGIVAVGNDMNATDKGIADGLGVDTTRTDADLAGLLGSTNWTDPLDDD